MVSAAAVASVGQAEGCGGWGGACDGRGRPMGEHLRALGQPLWEHTAPDTTAPRPHWPRPEEAGRLRSLVHEPRLQGWPWPTEHIQPQQLGHLAGQMAMSTGQPLCWVCGRGQGTRARPPEASVMTGIVTVASTGKLTSRAPC